MTLKSVVRRGALATVAAASAVALAACGAGQISQTANQVAAVDGAQNEQDVHAGGLAVRDAHIIVDPESGEAALKFSVTNQERANDHSYTLESIEVEGAGDVEMTPVASTERYDAASQGEENVIPRDCQLVADYRGAVEQHATGAEGNPACITYVATSLDAGSLVGSNASASGENREVTFKFSGPNGTEEIKLFVTISPYIPEAGSTIRNERGEVEGAAAAEATDAEADDTAGMGSGNPGDQVTGRIATQ